MVAVLPSADPPLGGAPSRHEVRRIVSLAGLTGRERVLCLAPGEGTLEIALAPWCTSLIGARFDESLGARARARVARSPTIEIVVGRPDALPLPEHSVDVVLAFDTLETFERVDLAAFGRAALRWLRPGGRLVAEVPGWARGGARGASGHRPARPRVAPDALCETLRNVGFDRAVTAPSDVITTPVEQLWPGCPSALRSALDALDVPLRAGPVAHRWSSRSLVVATTRVPGLDRRTLADHIVARLDAVLDAIAAEYAREDRVRSFVVDDLLPPELARAIFDAFPPPQLMMLKSSLRERKFVSAQMDRHAYLLEEAVFAFQDPRVLERIAQVTAIPTLEADPDLYAGGVSAMVQGHFLCPHLDNSHDGSQSRYRALNALYYVTPDWREDDGGHLELWDHGLRSPPRTIHSRFNRLVVMRTDRRSFHAVSPIVRDGRRCCVSNYYFSRVSPTGTDYFHATSFRGWPDQPWRDALLRADAALRTTLLDTVLRGRYVNPHTYKRRA